MSVAPRVAVVVALWDGSSLADVTTLLRSLRRFDPGCAYDLCLSINGEKYVPDAKVASFAKYIFRGENSGFNLAAWDRAWRALPKHTHFLFLQDQCRARRNGWLQKFADRFSENPHAGVLGEQLRQPWDRPWSELCNPPESSKWQAQERAQFYYETLLRWKIDPGRTAKHVTTVVQFTSRQRLVETDGYRIGQNKAEAIAAEIAFSRQLAAKGYALTQLHRYRHHVFSHPQWPSDAPWWCGGSRLSRYIV